MKRKQSFDIFGIFVFIAIITLISLVIYLAITPKFVGPAYVKSLTWKRTVYEQEDYSTYECETVEIRDANGNIKTTESCGWESHTRTLNTFTSHGAYPDKPSWPVYSIGYGHYETRYEAYYVKFCSNDQCWTAWVTENDYLNYKPEMVMTIKVNYLGFVFDIKS